MSQKENSKLAQGSILALVIGLLIACVYSNNDMVSRLAIPGLALVPAALFTMISLVRGESWGKSGLILTFVLAVASYFTLRALASPVSVFAAKDSLLFLQAALVAFVVSLPANRRCLSNWLPWILVLVILVQCIPLPWQWNDTNWVPFRELAQKKHGISGFFGHRNFFAVLLGMSSLGLLSYAAVLGKNKRGSFFAGGIWVAVAVAGFILMFLSGSRGAWVSVLCAFALLVTLFLIWRSVSGEGSSRVATIVWGAMVIVGGVGVAVLGGMISESRGLDDERGFFFANARNDMLRMAANSEPDSLLIGGGARFFEYEARRVMEPSLLSNSGLGDPRVVHNEYIEALVNYGYLGMVLFMLLLGLCLILSTWQIFTTGVVKLSSEKKKWLAMQFTVLGILTAITVQCMVDFSLHVLPIMLLLGLVVGCTQTGYPKKIWSYCNAGLGILLIGLLVFVAFPFWSSHLKYETAKNLKQDHPLRAAKMLSEVAETTGNYEAAAEAAQLYGVHGEHSEHIELAEELYKKAEALYPYHIHTKVALGKIELFKGNFDAALKYLGQAEELGDRQNSNYGVKHLQGFVQICKIRQQLRRGELRQENSASVIKSMQDSLKLVSSKFVSTSEEERILNEARALNTLFKARHSAEKAIKSEGQGQLALSLAYVEEAQKLYKLAERRQPGISSQDGFILNTLKQQGEVYKLNQIEPNHELRNELDEKEIIELN